MSPELEAALERARGRKMTPQETFEQRVSFVSEGRNKDEVRRMLIESQGYPAEASERAAIVAWLRAQRLKALTIADAAPALSHRERDHVAGAIAIGNAADLIERGDHLTGETP